MKKKILIVEDDKIAAKDLAEQLQELDYDVVGSFPTGEESIVFAKHNNPDLILMDIVLRGEIDGIDTAAEILRFYNVPIIYVSGSFDERTIQRAKVTDNYGYILKPYEKHHLYAMIEMAFLKHKIEEQLRKSEKETKVFLQGIPDLIFRINREGLILDIKNTNISDFLLYQEEFLGEKIIDAFPRETALEFLLYINNTLKGNESKPIVFSLIRNSVLMYFEVRMEKLYENEVIAIIRNITDKKLKDNEIFLYSTKLKTLINNLNEGILLEDSEYNTAHINQSFCDTFGLEKNLRDYIGQKSLFNQIAENDDTHQYDQMFKKISIIDKLKVAVAHREIKLTNNRFYEIDYIPIYRNKVFSGQLWVFRDVSAKKKSEAALVYRLRFESMISFLSTRLVDIKYYEIKKALLLSLKEIGEFVGANRCYIYEFSKNEKVMIKLFEWLKDDQNKEMELKTKIPTRLMPWWDLKMQRRQYVYIPDVDLMPQEAYREQKLFKLQKLKSVLASPIQYEKKLFGFFGLDFKESYQLLGDDTIELLNIAGQLLVNAIMKMRREEEMHLFSRVIDSSGNGIIITDPNKYETPIVYTNPAFENITGYSSNQVLGKNYLFLKGEQTEHKTLEHIEKSINNGEPCHVVLKNYKQNGDYFWNDMAFSPVFNYEKKITHYIGSFSDITKQRNAELKLQELYNSLVDDIDTASKIQSYLVPTGIHFINEIAFSAYYSPSTRVGGDLFDILKLDENRHLVYIGDISGHGVQAALLMTAVKSIITMIMHQNLNDKPSAILERLNNYLMDEIFSKMNNYLTILLGIINFKTHEFTYCNAGHPSLIEYDILHKKISLTKEEGSIPVGWKRNYKYTKDGDHVVKITPEKLFFLYTDGIFECNDENGMELGIHGLMDIIVKEVNHSPCLAIPQKIKHFLRESKYDLYSDDFTILSFQSIGNLKQDAKKRKKVFQINADFQNVCKIRTQAEKLIIEWTSDNILAFKVELLVNEFLNNVIEHGLHTEQDTQISIILSIEKDISIEFLDFGISWELPTFLSSDIVLSDNDFLNNEERGRGLKIIKTMISYASRSRYENINKTVFKIALNGGKNAKS